MNLTPSNESPIFSKPVIPKVVFHEVTINGEKWKLYFYDIFQRHLIESDGTVHQKMLDNISEYVSEKFVDYRIQLHVKSLAYLVGIFGKKREIKFCSQRLNYELFVMQEYEISKDESPLKGYVDFKSHVESVASLMPEKFPSVIDITTHRGKLPDLVYDDKYENLEKDLGVIIGNLVEKVNTYHSTLFEKITDWGLSLTANFALIRIHLLKFLAILPSLDFDKSGTEIKRILVESLRRLFSDSALSKSLNKTGQEAPIPSYIKIMCQIVYYWAIVMPAKPLATFVRFSVRLMAKRFIAGETIELADKSLNKLFETQRDVTLDQLGELVVSEMEADNYCNKVLQLIDGFSLHVKKGDKNAAGINRAHV